ncbi:MAG TPA: hypothetical protein VJI33_03960 [Candidatus Paceibacterota bacterium]
MTRRISHLQKFSTYNFSLGYIYDEFNLAISGIMSRQSAKRESIFVSLREMSRRDRISGILWIPEIKILRAKSEEIKF